MFRKLILALLLFSTFAAYSQDAPAPAPTHLRIRVSEGVLRGMIAKEVSPLYPDAAHGKGTVTLHLLVDESGVPIKAEFESGNAAFAESAIEAANQWRFRPFTIDNKPVEVDSQLTFKFKK